MNIINGMARYSQRFSSFIITVLMMAFSSTVIAAKAEAGEVVIEPSAACTTLVQQISDMGAEKTKTVQRQLMSVYGSLAAFQSRNERFIDGYLGNNTRFWLSHFCTEFQIETVPKELFYKKLTAALTTASWRASQYPHWRAHVASPKDLLTANDYYQLTDDDMAALAVPATDVILINKTLKAIKKLISQQYTSLPDIHNALYPVLNPFIDSKLMTTVEVDTLVGYLSHCESELSAKENPTSSNSTNQSSTTKSLLGTIQTNNLTTKSTTFEYVTTQTVCKINTDNLTLFENNIQTANDTAKTKPNSIEALEQKIHHIIDSVVPKTTIALLEPVKNEVFQTRRLFNVALILHNITQHNQAIIDQALKLGTASVTSANLNWQSKPNCGCEDSHHTISGMNTTFYGFYNYWDRPTEDVHIDFSHLNRIGYVAATMKYNHQQRPIIALPPNWNTAPDQSQFIYQARRYRTSIDLVVTNPWELDEHALTGLLTDDMADKLTGDISMEMRQFPINWVKPVLSFGKTPMPTIGDGITLNLNLSVLTDAKSQQQFINFITRLRHNLDQLDRGLNSSKNEHYLNLLMPIDSLIGKDKSHTGFYTTSNIRKISPLINLFIVYPNQVNSVNDIHRYTELTKITAFNTWMSQQDNQQQTGLFHKKIIPLLINPFNRNNHDYLQKLIYNSKWNYEGGAFWPVPLADDNEKLITQVFFPSATSSESIAGKITYATNQLFNMICPMRWLIRTILSGIFVLFVLIALLSVWINPLKRLLLSIPFIAIACFAIIALNLSLLADPYFADVQALVFIGFLALIVIMIVGAYLLRRQKMNP